MSHKADTIVKLNSSYLESLENLAKANQHIINNAIKKMRTDSDGGGLNPHPLQNGFYEFYANKDLRIVYSRSNGEIILHYAAHHDKAINWTKDRKSFKEIDSTGIVVSPQVRPASADEQSIPTIPSKPSESDPSESEENEMSQPDSWVTAISHLAKEITGCTKCCKWSGKDYPNPGWVGPQFEVGRGIAVVLQNPGQAPLNYGKQRDSEHQCSIVSVALTTEPQQYIQYSKECIDDMLGNGFTQKPWPKWTHPVSKLVREILEPNEIAWLNVVQHRTIKNSLPSREQIEHGCSHLSKYLQILQPSIVVAVGKVALSSLQYIMKLKANYPGTKLFTIKHQGSSTNEAEAIRLQISEILKNVDSSTMC